MKSKQRKTEELEGGAKSIADASTVILADHTGLSSNDMNALRKVAFALGGKVSVMKKRLLKLALKKAGLLPREVRYEGHISTITSPKDISETAAVVYKFSKEHKDMFRLVGGYTMGDKSYLDEKMVVRIGQLPSREVLLSQLVGMFVAPIRSFLFVLNEKAKKL